ncbi:AzlC family ABC transporter permease [Janibacter sp. GXQ6167]|uniref:AzlC family ABC transporter permease n=1 Tax=Janibacter sp. GXQ6167 TaxID=3240791 RepID=UPI003523E31D
MTLTAAQRDARRQGLSVGVATGAYGVSFGALSVAAGFDIAQTMALSLLLFSGGSQFAIIGIVGAGGGAGSAIAASTLLGVRNGLYSLETSRILRPRGWRRLAAAHLTIDESTAVALGQEEPAAQRTGFWVTGLAVFALWNLMTLAGAALGSVIGDPRTYGLDAAAAAAFCALLWPRLRTMDARLAMVIAALIAAGLSGVLPPGLPVLAATAAAVLIGSLRPHRDGPSPHDASPGTDIAHGRQVGGPDARGLPHLDGEDPTP